MATPTEDTITVLIKEELNKRKVKAEALVKLSTPVGLRKPDVYCSNGGNYVVEAKVREEDFFRVIGKIYDDYLKYYEELELTGGFALLYPEELTSIPIDELKTRIHEVQFRGLAIYAPNITQRNTIPIPKGNLNQVLDEIAKQILEPIEIEPNIPFIIKSLRRSSNVLIRGLKKMAGNQFEGIFGGKNVFENILQYEEHKYPIEEMRLAISYLLINQIIFYHILSKNNPLMFPEIVTSKLTKPEELNNYFKKVLDRNYEVVFSYDVASLFFRGTLTQLKDIINVIKGIAPEKIKKDLLGTMFHDLIPYDIRKKVAAFYTNTMAAELLAKLSISKCYTKVADFACGSGGLLVGAYKRKKELLVKKEEFTLLNHKRFLRKEIFGVDVMPFAAHLAAMHLALQSPSYFTKRLSMAVWDSTELSPNSKIPAVADLRYMIKGQTSIMFFSSQSRKAKGAINLKKRKKKPIKLQYFDVILMNPPFTRHERIPENYKNILNDRFINYKDSIDGQMSYFNYFLLLADRFLNSGGIIAYVLPATFLRVRSSKKVRTFLTKHYKILYIIANIDELNFSDSTWKREILLIAQKKRQLINISKDDENRFDYVTIVHLPRLPLTSNEVNEYFKTITNFRNNKNFHTNGFTGINIDSNEFMKNVDNWYKYIAFGEEAPSLLWEEIIENCDKLIKFKPLIKKLMRKGYNINIKRGIETSQGMKVQYATILCNENRAVSKEDKWVVKNEIKKRNRMYLSLENRKNKKIKVEIPKDTVLKTMRTLSQQEYCEISKDFDYVVVKRCKNSSIFFEKEPAVINVLPNWKVYVERRRGNLIIMRRIYLPASGTRFLAYFSTKNTTSQGVTWISSGMSKIDAKILTLWFNSGLHLLQLLIERIEDVYINVHKYVLEEYYVPNLLKISDQDKCQLINLYKRIKNVKFDSIYKESLNNFQSRQDIDKKFLEIFGFNENQIENRIKKIYTIISEKISELFMQMSQRT